MLWSVWAIRVTICSVVLAFTASSVVTFFIYILKSKTAVDIRVMGALFEIFKFWFVLIWNLTVLIALFRSLKYIFNICIDGYMFKLLTCSLKDFIVEIGYGDLVKVFRKQLFLLIWLVGALMIIALIITNIFGDYKNLFDWFNIYWLYAFLMIAGYFSFIILGSRCKKVKIIRC